MKSEESDAKKFSQEKQKLEEDLRNLTESLEKEVKDKNVKINEKEREKI